MTNMKKIMLMLTSTLFALTVFTSCQPENTDVADDEKLSATFNAAVAVLQPTEGSSVKGIVRFKKVEDGIEITADVSGLEPGKHGFHIHEFGDIRKSDGTSAGGHFNPYNMDHGAPTDSVRHVGDLGNLMADENGNAHYERVDSVIAFSELSSILGRAVIVHSGEDDLSSQPTGAAGSRLAMGVIGVANPGYSEEM